MIATMDIALVNDAVAAVLRAEAKVLGVTQDQLAQAAGISKVTVQRYLAGTRELPVAAAIAMAQALNMTGTQLFDEAERRAARGAGTLPNVRPFRARASEPEATFLSDDDLRGFGVPDAADDGGDWQAEDEGREDQP